MARSINWGQPINWAHALNRGLVARWQATPNRNRGGKLFDLCGRNHGTLTNSPTWSSAKGRPGGFGAITFASTALVSIPDNPVLKFTTGGYTLAAWFRTTSTTQGALMERADGTGDFAPMLGLRMSRTTAGDIALLSRDSTGTGTIFVTSGGWHDGNWHMVVATRSAAGTVHSLYVDGVFRTSSTTAAYGTVDTTQPFRIGATYDPTTFPGDIDEVCMWRDRALSAAEVAALYRESRQGSPNTLNWYRRPRVSLQDAGGGGGTSPFFYNRYVAGRAAWHDC